MKISPTLYSPCTTWNIPPFRPRPKARKNLPMSRIQLRFSPQSREWEETSLYSESGSFRFTVEMKNTVPIEQAAREIKLFLKDKDQGISKRWPISKIKEFIVGNLEKDGCDATFVSRENLSKAKQAFGPMLRELGRETPRMKMQPDDLVKIQIDDNEHGLAPQFFNESSLKSNGYLFLL